jgi:hypothetical protein
MLESFDFSSIFEIFMNLSHKLDNSKPIRYNKNVNFSSKNTEISRKRKIQKNFVEYK